MRGFTPRGVCSAQLGRPLRLRHERRSDLGAHHLARQLQVAALNDARPQEALRPRFHGDEFI